MSCIIEGANARPETSEVKDFSAAALRFPYVLVVRGLRLGALGADEPKLTLSKMSRSCVGGAQPSQYDP
jgi:hypothetical protein